MPLVDLLRRAVQQAVGLRPNHQHVLSPLTRPKKNASGPRNLEKLLFSPLGSPCSLNFDKKSSLSEQDGPKLVEIEGHMECRIKRTGMEQPTSMFVLELENLYHK